MNKKLALLLVCTMIAVVLVGCGGNKIVGTWVNEDLGQTITFENDGTFTQNLDGYSMDGEYSVSDNVITLSVDGYGSEEIPFEINGNELRFSEGDMTLVFIKR